MPGKPMKALAAMGALSLSLMSVQANAGCVTGAVVGGVAGHYAHHHALTGAIAGCVVGHELAVHKKKQLAAEKAAKQQAVLQQHPHDSH